MKTQTHPKTQIAALFICAMPEERTELQKVIQSRLTQQYGRISSDEIDFPTGSAQLLIAATQKYLLVTSGIGMVNAASALSTALTLFTPKLVLCVGSAGGLHPKIRVQDVIIGTEYINSRADATAFGYALGQVPGNPASLKTKPELTPAVNQAIKNCKTNFPEITIYQGLMLSSDAFVTDANIKDTRAQFPQALSADMESQAYAQAAHKFAETPYLCVRGISDLCGTPEDQSISFHAELSDVASRAAKVAFEICQQLIPPEP